MGLQITGRLTAPIRSNNVNGATVVNFKIAADLGYVRYEEVTNAAGQKVLAQFPVPTYFECDAWNGDSASAADLKKGQEVTFDALFMRTNPHEYDTDEGTKLAAPIQVRVTNVRAGAMPRGPRETVASGARTASSNGSINGAAHTEPLDDEIPW